MPVIQRDRPSAIADCAPRAPIASRCYGLYFQLDQNTKVAGPRWSCNGYSEREQFELHRSVRTVSVCDRAKCSNCFDISCGQDICQVFRGLFGCAAFNIYRITSGLCAVYKASHDDIMDTISMCSVFLLVLIMVWPTAAEPMGLHLRSTYLNATHTHTHTRHRSHTHHARTHTNTNSGNFVSH